MKNPRKLIIIGATIYLVAMLFILIETTVFCIIQGYHYEPTTIPEIYCDAIGTIGSHTGAAAMFIGLICTINKEG